MKRLGALVVALCLVLAACAKAGHPRVSQAIDDAEITTSVKTVLLNDQVLGLARIDVETSHGVVTLSGRVDSKDQETKAIGLARTVKGVADVKSTLQVR